MATIVVETGGVIANANSYCSVANADIYHETRLHNSTWTVLGDDGDDLTIKETALMWATRLIDQHVRWSGSRTSENQALGWPRLGMTSRNGDLIDENDIPNDIKYATAELAMMMIDSDRTAIATTTGFKDIKAGPISLKLEANYQPSVLPRSVWNFVRPYGVSNRKQRILVRV